jgi:hypothetical protein
MEDPGCEIVFLNRKQSTGKFFKEKDFLGDSI